MDDLPETSSQFRGLLRAQINQKLIRKRIRFFKNGRLGWDVLTISRSRWRFFCKKNVRNGRFAWDVLTILQTDTVVESIVTFQKRTFGLRRPHNFVFKCVQKWKIVWFFLWKTGVWLETSSQFRVLSGVFSFKKIIKKQKWPIGLRRPHNFAAGFAIKFLKKW